MTPGTCQYCACREDRACEGGCSWVNEDCTLCSSCQWAEEIAKLLVSVHEKVRGIVPVEWEDRGPQERTAFVMASRAVFEMLRESFLAAIGDEASAAAEELGRLSVFLQQKHPDAIARAGEDATVVDVALELLGERRIVLASEGL